jgi:hypothetical protein
MARHAFLGSGTCAFSPGKDFRGIAPATAPSVSLNIEMKAGYVIDLSDDPPPPPALRVISP